jgi:tRNA nucleotidyltransferase (CCA-adding enzyme)
MEWNKETLNHPLIAVVGSVADQLSVDTYVVGGYVRDLILKRDNKDIDFVCVGSGVELANAVAHKLDHNLHVHVFKTFGTAMFKYNDEEIEFVGARKESYNFESRKPTVESGSLDDDLSRRDFTINAMAVSINQSSYGQIIDRFDGLKDLKKKCIRTPLDPDITFSDDPLRMMRAIRFAAQLNFDIHPETFEAIIKNKERIHIVSKERIAVELNKIIQTKLPSYGFKLLYHAGLLEILFPEFVALLGVDTIENRSHKDNFYHTLQVLDNVAKTSDDLWLRWAAILHDIAKPLTKKYDPKIGFTFHGHEEKGARMVPGIFRKLRLPMNEKMLMVQKLVRLHLRPIALVKDTVTDSAVRRLMFESGEHFKELMLLCRADVTSKNNSKVKRYIENFDKVEQKVNEVEEKDSLRLFQPVLTGEDIMDFYDLKPSKIVGDLKLELREAILEGKVKNNFEDLKFYLFKIAKQKGLELKK